MSSSNEYGYDYDEIMEYCKNDCNTTLEEFSTNLNNLADEMPLCEECFHSTKKGDALYEIYDGFSDCIGSTKANSGLAGLLNECVEIVNTVYSEAYNNKKIMDEGELSGTSSESNITTTSEIVNTAESSNKSSKEENIEASGESTITVPGNISPGTSEETYSAQSYELSDETYKKLCALVYAEAGQGSYAYSDAMGVVSTILNRMETAGFGDDVESVISSGFSGYQNSNYNKAMDNMDVISDTTIQAINDTLAGNRNTDALYFGSSKNPGVCNTFRKEY